MNVHVPSVPKSLRITQTMWSDFLCDPVLAVWCLFAIKLDAFQGARLRYYWWVQNVIDSSGVSSGKTICIWLFLLLRAMLLPDQECAVYYPTFETGKLSFWDYFNKIRAPIFRAQLGQADKLEAGEEVDGDGTVHGPACYKAFFRNGGKVLMPAPSFMKDAVTQASLRLNTLVVEEYPQVDASSDGIDKQLIDRTTRESWNQNHPIWGNHILFSGHAHTRLHKAYVRFKAHQRRVDAGDATYSNVSYSYKDYSLLDKGLSGQSYHAPTGNTFRKAHRIEATINNKRNKCSKVMWLGQGFGIWSVEGSGWFTEAAIAECVESGKRRGVVPVLSRRQWEEEQKRFG